MPARRIRHISGTRLHGPAWLGGTIQFLILTGAAQARHVEVWPWALLAVALISLLAWIANYRRYRHIHDLPTSRIASAPQGYVELFGRCEQLPESVTVSRFSQTPCCWHAWRVRRRTRKGGWETIDRGRHDVPFLLIDDSGECIVVPNGSEVLSGFGKSWHEGEREFTEWMLGNGAMLYAIGAFDTSRNDVADADGERTAVAQLLAEWKSDPVSLRTRFDHDGDGRIDLREWEEARVAAQREIRERQLETVATARPVHTLARPRDGRLFLLANSLPERIAMRFRYWSWAHLAFCVISGAAGMILLPGSS